MRLVSKIGFIFLGLIMFAIFFVIGVSITQTAPKILLVATGINNWEYKPLNQTVIYYSDGQVMDRVGYKKIYSQDFPEYLKQAVVAVEDKRFYSHAGLDTKGIGRAIYNNIRAGRKAEGGSTITQQLARTLFLNQQKTYTRKVKEVFYATALEEKYSKDAILNMYLNEIYMGRGCSGMACAAQSYFGKDVYSLTKAQMTMLVAIIAAPEYYSPDRNMAGVKERTAAVTDVLVEQGILTEAEGDTIKQTTLSIRAYEPNQTAHPYFMAYLTSKLEQLVGPQQLYRGGLKIYTTLDRHMQKAAEQAVKSQARSLAYRGINVNDIALASVDPTSGAIRAMVGGVDFSKNQNNMAVLPRQPGSAIKPLYYAAAMDEDIIMPDTVLNNKVRDFNGYRPKNYSSSPDRVTVRDALVHSYNVASVEVLNKLGPDKAIEYLTNYGVTTVDPQNDNNLALGLGGMTKGISPLQMASAYTAFANRGVVYDYYSVDKILTDDGDVVFINRSASRRVISSNSAILIDDILQDVVRYGTGTSARIALKSGGKTGTTTDSRDLWYMGYTSELVTAIWAGNSDGTPVKGYGTYGGTVAAPIWRNYMNTLYYAGVFNEKPEAESEETPAVEEQPTTEEPAVEEPAASETPSEGENNEEQQSPTTPENPENQGNQGTTQPNQSGQSGGGQQPTTFTTQ
ncbi:MAG TPA: PBP1A family penicillin-binding protein [Syntrophomonadaceae bacterium]|nr:PBP1A family penicillin-binding protein [Syntrophomonadaceae bacterium]